MLSDGLRALLLATPSVTAIVGTKDTRLDKKSGVYCAYEPEEVLAPNVAISQISGEGIPTMEGPDGLHSARMQFSCYGEKYADAIGLSRAIRNLLEGLNGAGAVQLPDGTTVGQAILRSESDGFQEAPFLFHCPLDFEFWYSEP